MRNLHELDRYRVSAKKLWGWDGDHTCGAFVVPSPIDGAPMPVIASAGELWKPIAGYEALYDVSTTGRVRAKAKSISLPYGGFREHVEADLSQDVMKKGYRRVALCHRGGQQRVLVHVLVARAFISNPHNYPMVNHIDGNKGRNVVSNLEWCSDSYNIHHAIENGWSIGMTTEMIGTIKEMLAGGMSDAEVAAQVNRSAATIHGVGQGRHRNLTPDEPSRYDGPALWDHVSVSRRNRTPNWQEMEHVKRLFFAADEIAVQFHVAEADHISIHPHTLHLWRWTHMPIPLPPKELV